MKAASGYTDMISKLSLCKSYKMVRAWRCFFLSCVCMGTETSIAEHPHKEQQTYVFFLQGGSAVPHESPDFGSLNP